MVASDPAPGLGQAEAHRAYVREPRDVTVRPMTRRF